MVEGSLMSTVRVNVTDGIVSLHTAIICINIFVMLCTLRHEMNLCTALVYLNNLQSLVFF